MMIKYKALAEQSVWQCNYPQQIRRIRSMNDREPMTECDQQRKEQVRRQADNVLEDVRD